MGRKWNEKGGEGRERQCVEVVMAIKTSRREHRGRADEEEW